MGGVYTIYAYFNAQQIQGVLNAIVMLVGSGGVDGDYLSIVRVASMLGLFVAVTLGFVKARGEDAGQYLVLMAIFYSVLFVPRVSVTIEEKGGSSAGAPIVVANVPLGLAFFASTTSHIGYWLTERTETFFALPNAELKLSKHGMLGGARALREAQNSAMPDPVLAQDMINFMRECINPELVASAATLNSILKSTNLWADFAPLVNPARLVVLAGGVGATSCKTAYDVTIGTRLAPAATSELQRLARIISPEATPAMANTILGSMLPGAEGMMMTASASAAEGIKQRMMINMLNDTSSNMAQVMNDPVAAQTALGTAIASSNANSAYRVMAKLASETLPMARNAIELVILGVFPIVLLLIIVAGTKGGALLRSYVMTMLWVQLWAPLYAIVNYVGTMAHVRTGKAALAGIDGIAIANAAAFANTAISAEAVAGMLTIAVPMIALALVKGGEVATAGIASSLTGGANTAAQSAGAQVGSGNVQMGNVSWGNVSTNNTASNSHDGGFKYKMPNMAQIGGQRGSYNILEAGQFDNLQANQSNIGSSAATGARVEAGREYRSQTEAGLMSGKETSLARGTAGAFTQSENAGFQAKLTKNLAERFGGGEKWSAGSAAGSDLNAAWGVDLSQTFGNEARATISSNLNGGIRVGQSGKEQHTGSVSEKTSIPTSGGATGGSPGGSQSRSALELARGYLGLSSKDAGMQVAADHGLKIDNTVGKGDGGSKRQSSSEAAAIQSKFDSVRNAVLEVVGQNGTAGERAAGEAFLGQLSNEVKAQYGVSTRSTLTQSASEGDSGKSALSVDTTTSYSNQVQDKALQQFGSPERVFQEMRGNPGAMQTIAEGIAAEVKEARLPGKGQPVRNFDGEQISRPKDTQTQQREGDTRVAADRPINERAATQAGRQSISQAAAQQEVPKAMPDQTSAKEAWQSVHKEAMQGHEGAVGAVRTNRGIMLTAEAIHKEGTGMGSLALSTYAGGAADFFGLNQGGQQIQEQLSRLAAADPSVREALGKVAAFGKANEASMQALGTAVKDFQGRLSAQYQGDWVAAAKQTGVMIFGKAP